MKKLSLFSIITFVLFLSNCKEVDKLTQFEMEYTSEATIPKNTIIDLPIDITTPAVETNAEEKFAVNDTRKDLVEEITLTHLNLSVISPEGQDFDFIKSIKIYINAKELEEKLIAWKENVGDDVGSELELNTTSDDLKSYIKKNEFSLRFLSETDKALDNDVEIEIYSRFFVDAEILGV